VHHKRENVASVDAPNRHSAFYDRLRERIAGGEVVVLDGGTGTELQARGVPMDGEAWSAVANLTHLDTVQELHASFLAAGADVLITNTFAAGPGPLVAAGYADRVEEANVNAVAVAAAARAQAGREDVVIAGSMSRMVANGLSRSEPVDARSANEAGLLDAFRRQARILAGAGVDVIALEMMGAKAHAAPAVEAAAETGLPVWLGVSVVEAAGGRATTVDGEDVAELIESVQTEAVDAVLVMHTDIGLVSDSLPAIGAVWPGTVGAYPHVGDWTPPNWVFHDISPSAFADDAGDWAAQGAAIIGGCCGIGPEHIAELAAALRPGRA
jgi:S-methylmethionine-dependent homocysteine/selenocysteine methylase